MDSKQHQLVNRYLDLFYRKKFLILFFFLVSLPVGLGSYLTMPKVYQASSLLSYQQQKISPNKLSPDVESRIRDIVSTLRQIVTSRTNLEKMIVSYDLYRSSRERLPMEDVVDSMRKKIKIDSSAKGNIFKIAFEDSDPAKAAKVTNGLAAKFIEENLKYREERASETSSYTSDELLMAKETMDRKESAMRDYKVGHYNEMPEQRMTNVSRLIALQKQNQGKQESIQDLERTLVLIQDQISNRKTILAGEQALASEVAGAIAPVEKIVTRQQRLRQLRLILSQLETRYTERHPEVRKTKAMIARLEQEVGREENTSDSSLVAGENIGKEEANPLAVDKIILQLETQKKNVLLNIESLKAEKKELNTTIAKYEAWVEATPVREAEWAALTREYGQLKRHYEYLVAQDLEAKSMLNLERRQKGSQFKIEDPARYPEKPVKPVFINVIGIALLGGLAVGVGLTLITDFLDGSYRDPDMIESRMGLPLLTTIPLVGTALERRKERRKTLLVSAAFLILFLLVAAIFVVVWRKDLIVL